MTPTSRARLLVLLSFPIVIGIALAIKPRQDAGDLVAWLALGEVVFVIGVAVNAHRQEHHLTRQQLLAQVIAWGIALAIVLTGVFVIPGLYYAIRDNWQSVSPILVVVGVGVTVLAIALLVIYLVVRVVRVAWKGR